MGSIEDLTREIIEFADDPNGQLPIELRCKEINKRVEQLQRDVRFWRNEDKKFKEKCAVCERGFTKQIADLIRTTT